MPAFPRTVLPRRPSVPRFPETLRSTGGTGKVQTRAPLIVGVTWQEEYPALDWTDAVVRGWLAQVEQFWRTGTKFTIDHRAYLTQKGAGGGTPLINGASQTGSSINTDGWPNDTTVLKAGDLVRFGALSIVDWLVADALTNGSGQVALQLARSIVTGGSPADNASVLYGASITFQCVLTAFEPGEADPDQFIDGLVLGFQETT
jgi:hypothetical protein